MKGFVQVGDGIFKFALRLGERDRCFRHIILGRLAVLETLIDNIQCCLGFVNGSDKLPNSLNVVLISHCRQPGRSRLLRSSVRQLARLFHRRSLCLSEQNQFFNLRLLVFGQRGAEVEFGTQGGDLLSRCLQLSLTSDNQFLSGSLVRLSSPNTSFNQCHFVACEFG